MPVEKNLITIAAALASRPLVGSCSDGSISDKAIYVDHLRLKYAVLHFYAQSIARKLVRGEKLFVLHYSFMNIL